MKNMKKMIAMVLALMMLSLSGCNAMSNQKPFQDVDFAMGTVISQNIYGENGAGTAKELLALIKELEETISWRIPDSSVAAINESAGSTEAVEVEEELIEWIRVCGEVREKSGGALDLTVGPAARLWDIGGEAPKVPSADEIEEILPLIDGSRLIVNDETVLFMTEGGQLDLGAVGKGIACDVMEEYLRGKEIAGTFSAGGSILINGQKPNGEPWKIGIQDPRGEEGSYMGALAFDNEKEDKVFVSTSGDYEKYIEENGVRYHHILDPKTGAPAESDLISVTAISSSGLLSDALSTACFVAGSEKAVDIAKEFDAEVVLVDREKNVILSEGAKELFSLLDKEYKVKDEKK